MDDTERVPLEHDLPPDLRDAVADDTASLAALYNGLQDLDDTAFSERFGPALSTFREVLDGREGPVSCVLGLAVEETAGEREVTDAALAVARVPDADAPVYVGDGPEEEFLLLPVRADDCPPGSGRPASEIDAPEFREVVSAMAYKRFDLLQNDLDAYREAYLRPLVRGLEAYAERR